MMGRLFEQLIFRWVRLFYSQVEVRGSWPDSGPVIYVLNHPNGLLDPALVMAARLERVTFLAKSTLFAMPAVGWTARQFGALPVFRAVDVGLRGAAADAEDMAGRNEATFAVCRARLHQGRALALFPEGKTHGAPQLLPIRTGAARVALTTACEAGWHSGLIMVPVGLWYEDMTRFRTRVILNVGRKVGVDRWQQVYEEDARAAVQQLTAEVEKRLEATLLQAESHRLLRRVSLLAAWTAPGEDGHAAGEQLDWSARLLRGHSYLRVQAPERIERIKQTSKSFGIMLQTAGIDNPRDLELQRAGRGWLTKRVGWLVVMALPALAGAGVGAIPWGVIRVLAHRVRRTEAGTIKLLGGTMLSGLSVAAWAMVLAFTAGIWWAVGLLVLAPGCLYAVLRWYELYQETQTAISVRRLQRRRTPLVEYLTRCREALTEAVHDALVFAEKGQ
ncbi:MAG: 1-acyl-sn-glycerol-3-phosphate acyltransferase [Bacteroidota bacterium]|nr:1-acyl-sn-glycerol-3-phosphate acyltransferase [Bacteroidota bacterium]